jgi:hypothetical protein
MSRLWPEADAVGQVPFARRTFLGAALLATGAALSGALARLVGGTHDAQRVAADAAAGEAGADTPTDEDAWHVDDMWGHRPRYAHPIPHAGVALDPVSWDHVDPIDRPFVI